MTQNLTDADEHRLRVRARIVADDERVRQLREQEITVGMTDAEIDGLSGRQLREAVCLAFGWTREGESGDLFRSPGGNVKGWYDLPKPNTDLGAAMGLLMGLDHVSIEWHGESLSVFWFEPVDVTVVSLVNPIADGPKSEAATVICKAYLKLKNRGA